MQSAKGHMQCAPTRPYLLNVGREAHITLSYRSAVALYVANPGS